VRLVGRREDLRLAVVDLDLALGRGQQTAKAGWAARFMDAMRAKKAAKK